MPKKDIIDQFLDKRLKFNEGTRKSYRGFLERYFRLLDKTPDDYRNVTVDTIEKDVVVVMKKLHEKGKETKKILFNIVKLFCIYCNPNAVNMDIWFIIRNDCRGATKTTIDVVPEPQQMKEILEYADVKMKAMMLTMISSGMRIGELLKIEPPDLHLNKDPPLIELRTTKGDTPRIVYISYEARDTLKAWLKIRDEYLSFAVKKSQKHIKDSDDPRVFPMYRTTFYKMWYIMMRKAEMDQRDRRTNIMQFHPHCLRSYFQTYLGDINLAQKIMGHKGYLSTYDHEPQSSIAKKYLHLMNNLSVFVADSDERIDNLQDQLNKKDDELKDLKAIVDELKAQVVELRLEKLEKKNGMR